LIVKQHLVELVEEKGWWVWKKTHN